MYSQDKVNLQEDMEHMQEEVKAKFVMLKFGIARIEREEEK